MSSPRLLIIGYGNTLRGDDGVGQRVAEALRARALPGVQVTACHQLAPELADPVSRAGAVIFVDAAVDEPRAVRFRSLQPAASSQILTHAASPETLLALARDVFHHAPPAWQITVPAVAMDFSEELSATAQAGMTEALERILRFADEPLP